MVNIIAGQISVSPIMPFVACESVEVAFECYGPSSVNVTLCQGGPCIYGSSQNRVARVGSDIGCGSGFPWLSHMLATGNDYQFCVEDHETSSVIGCAAVNITDEDLCEMYELWRPELLIPGHIAIPVIAVVSIIGSIGLLCCLRSVYQTVRLVFILELLDLFLDVAMILLCKWEGDLNFSNDGGSVEIILLVSTVVSGVCFLSEFWILTLEKSTQQEVRFICWLLHHKHHREAELCHHLSPSSKRLFS